MRNPWGLSEVIAALASAVVAMMVCANQVMAVKSEAEPAMCSPIADKWAVVVGISEFADPKVPTLKYSAKDAKDFYEYLTDPGAGRFAKDHVRLLLNADATKTNIMDAIGDSFLPHAANPNDLVLIYLSTHGSPAGADVRGVNYIVAHDTQVNKLFATGIEMKQLLQLIKERVHTNRILLVMDTCYSGAVAETGAKALVRSNVDSKTIAQGIGSLCISSSSPEQRAWESDQLRNSYFTRFLIESLRQDHGKVPIDQAFKSMKDKVQEAVLRDKGELQTPVMSGVFRGPSLVLGLSPTVSRIAPDLIELPSPSGAETAAGSLDNYSTHMKAAHKLIEQHKQWDAIHELEAASQLNPYSVEAYLLLAEVYDQQNRYREALEAAKKAVLNDEKSSRAREKLGLAYLRTGHKEEALRQAQKAVSLDPTNSMAHTLMGYILHKEFARVDQAEQEYLRALELNNLNVRALVNLGLLLQSENRDLDRAEKCFHKAIASDIDDWEAHYALGQFLYKERKNYAEACQHLNKAIELDPANWKLHTELGVVRALSGQKKEAEEELRKGLSLAPGNAVAHYALADFLALNAGRIDEAEKEYNQAIGLDANLAAARVGLGILVINHRSRYDQAETQFRKALSLEPRNALARVGLARVFAELHKNYSEADKELRQALQIDPNLSLAHDQLGVLLSTGMARYDEALKEFDEAIKGDPSNPAPYYHRGKLLLTQYNNYDLAMQDFEKALAVNPGNADSLTQKGILLTKFYKRHKDAEVALRQALEVNLSNPEAHYRLGMLLIERLGQRQEGERELRKALEQAPENKDYRKAFDRYVH